MAKKNRTPKGNVAVTGRVANAKSVMADVVKEYQGQVSHFQGLMGDSFTGLGEKGLLQLSEETATFTEQIKSGLEVKDTVANLALLCIMVLAEEEVVEVVETVEVEAAASKVTKTKAKKATDIEPADEKEVEDEDDVELTLEEELLQYTNAELKAVVKTLELSAGKKPNKAKLIETILTAEQDKVYEAIDSLDGDDE